MDVFVTTLDFTSSSVTITHCLDDVEFYSVVGSLSAVREWLDFHSYGPLDHFKLVSARLYRSRFTGFKNRVFRFKYI